MHRHSIRILWTLIITLIALIWTAGMASAYLKADMTPIGPGDTPDYLTSPNWAYSPPLRKFVDTLPGLTAAGANNLGQYLPVAVPDITTYPGSDYYEIELVQYTEQMHSDLPPTTLRGYRQVNDGTDSGGNPIVSDKTVHFLGPVIVSTKDRPVRVKFINSLPTGSGGDLFIPVDESVMGAGDFEIDYDPVTKEYPLATKTGRFTQNRALLHLHGGRSPWISDGSPHQWITPAGETTDYPTGASVVNVPDMPNPGPGAQTYYWTNQQSARFMFYHDHAWGITRLNVYVGEAAGYVITDPVETQLITDGLLPSDMIPLVVQDRTYVDPLTIKQTDPTWIWGTRPWIGTGPMTPVKGDLWWPHVYMPAQNPFDPTGIAPMGRWAYGPYFWPATNNPFQPVANPYYNAACDPLNPGDPATTPGSFGGFCQPPEIPSTPNPSWGAEAFMDTPNVNGTAYPVLNVEPKAYRLRFLNAAHDRFFNFSIFEADTTRDANLENVTQCSTLGGCATATEVKMVDAGPTAPDPLGTKPASWPEDGRPGGVPDWDTAGPNWIMYAAEAGFLPKPVVIPAHPVDWNVDVTTFNAGNVNAGSLILAPAERADVVVDFSAYAGKTLILYNDAPAPWPALDPHYDYYTGAPDNRDMGGADTTLAGVGPNTRTIMQIRVAATTPAATFDLAALNEAFLPADGTTPGVFERGQDPLIVGQGNMNPAGDPALYSAFIHDGVDYDVFNKVYHRDGTSGNELFPKSYPNWGVAQINDNEIHFTGTDGSTLFNFDATDTTLIPYGGGATLTGGVYLQPKAIQDEQGETFDDYGRMRAALGLTSRTPGAGQVNFTVQTYSDPSTEIIGQDETQVWKITHNGVDTHPIHFHLFDVQVLNRVGWDGFLRFPDPTEFGWKDTVRISPLEDTIVAVRPVTPRVPFGVPENYRPLNPARPIGDTTELSLVDPNTAAAWAVPNLNRFVNNDWEYVWHCHILSHEENDMMRTIQFQFIESLPLAPYDLAASSTTPGRVDLTWGDTTPWDDPNTLGNPTNEVQFQIERSVANGPFAPLAVVRANVTSYSDTTATDGPVYRYRVYGANATAQTTDAAGKIKLTPGFMSNVASYPPIPVQISAPFDGSNYLAPANQTLTVKTQAGIDSVQLYSNSVALGAPVAGSSVFTFDLVDLTPGSYVLTAVGTDSSTSLSYTSDPITIQVTAAPPIANFTYSGSLAGSDIGICETVDFDASSSGHTNPDYAGALTYAWSLTGNPTTVTVTGQSFGTIGGAYPVTLTVTDSIGQSASITKNVVITNHPPLANANTGAAYFVATGADITLAGSGTVVDTCDTTPLIYSWDLNGDAVADTTTATPTVTFAQLTSLGIGPGSHIIDLTVTDGGGVSGTDFADFNLQNPTLITDPVNNSTLTAATQTFTWTNDGADLYQILVGTTAGGYEILVSAGLPAGTTSYTVSGLPVDGVPVYVRLSSRFSGIWSSNDFTYTGAGLHAAPPSITVPPRSSSGSYTVSWEASTTPGVTYTLEESTDNFATAPANTTVVATGLTGTSAAFTGKSDGIYSYRVKAVMTPMLDSVWTAGANGCDVSRLAVSNPSILDASVNVAYTQTVYARGGFAPFIWSATGLPTGLTINPGTGVISGTPDNVVPSGSFATFTVNVTLTDSMAVTATKTYTMVVYQTAPAAPSGLLASSPSSTSVVLTWTDNANNETGVQVQRATDAGFTTALTEVWVSGNALTTYTDNTVVGGTTYYYRVRNSSTSSWSTSFSNTVTVTPALPPALLISNPSILDGSVNVAYTQTVYANGGIGSYTWSATGLPSGLTINSGTGVISGTPGNVVPSDSFASFTVNVTVTDSTAVTTTKTYTMVVYQTAPAAPSGLLASSPSSTSVVLTWTDNANNETGVQVQRATDAGFTTALTEVWIFGTTLTSYTDNTVVGGTTYYYRVRNSSTSSWSTSFSNTVSVTTAAVVVPALVISNPSILDGSVNAAYTQTVYANGGVAPYTWSAIGLPSGLTINSGTGVISGAPGNVVPSGSFASFTVNVTVADSTAVTTTKTYTMVVYQTAPAAPSGLLASSPSSTSVVLTWTDNANNETGVQVQRATDAGFTTALTEVWIFGTTLTTYTDNTVVGGTTYYYRVRNSSTSSWSTSFSNTVTITP